jgi:hypothetical protein
VTHGFLGFEFWLTQLDRARKVDYPHQFVWIVYVCATMICRVCGERNDSDPYKFVAL